MCLKQFVKILTKSLTTLKKVCRIPVFRGLHHECLEAILRKS